jgi:predicted glutamate--cysteine ligase
LVLAPLYLALSASSPFLDGKITGSHSRRWQVFPQTPAYVPLFESHKHFVTWTEEQLKLGTMQNVRHLWVSVRPNGSNRPYNLNRLELRICDLIADPISLLAVMAFLEARLTQLLQAPQLDPLTLTQENEQAAARFSLDATLKHWYDGREILARDWIKDLYVQVYPVAKARGFSCFLSPLQKILREGNTAQQWLKQSDQGMDVKSIIKQAIITLEKQERELEHKLCQHILVA